MKPAALILFIIMLSRRPVVVHGIRKLPGRSVVRPKKYARELSNLSLENFDYTVVGSANLDWSNLGEFFNNLLHFVSLQIIDLYFEYQKYADTHPNCSQT